MRDIAESSLVTIVNPRRLAVRVVIDPARVQQWHAGLLTALATNGHNVDIALKPGAGPLPITFRLLLQLERLIRRRSTMPVADPLAAEALMSSAPPSSGASPDVVIDLSGSSEPPPSGRWLKPVYAGSPRFEAAAAALLSGTAPELGVYDSEAANRPRLVRAAVEMPTLLSVSLDNLAARMRSLLVDAVAAVGRGEQVAGSAIRPLDSDGAAPFSTIGSWTGAFRLGLDHLSRHAPYWYIGWRRCDADRLTETMSIPAGGWIRVKDDGMRYFADPLLVTHEQRRFLFVEELPYATGKGILSVMEMGADGPGAPRPVLEEPHHLSYPFIFPHGGQMWMIPESCAVGRIDLYRADRFPDRWVFETSLVTGVEASDATLLEHNGRLWLFATVSGDGASSWDALHLWSADRLHGPWTPHRRNAVLVDALGARSAGPFYKRGNELWRPAQDCTTGYGRGLALCRVTKLDDDAYVQSVEKVLHPNPDWPGIGFHTIHWDNGIEVVDGCTPLRG